MSQTSEAARVAIYVRTGWMLHYGMKKELDGPIGGGSYNRDNVGSEHDNFRPVNGRLYGYGETGAHLHGFNLERIAPARIDRTRHAIDGVTVVILAPHRQRGQLVVGWYKDATVYDRYRDRREDSLGMEQSWYNFEAVLEDCVLVPPNERQFVIPQGQGAVGQKNICYPLEIDGSPKDKPWMREALEYVEHYKGFNPLRSRRSTKTR